MPITLEQFESVDTKEVIVPDKNMALEARVELLEKQVTLMQEQILKIHVNSSNRD